MAVISASYTGVVSISQVTASTPTSLPQVPAGGAGPLAVRMDGRGGGLSVINPANWVNSGSRSANVVPAGPLTVRSAPLHSSSGTPSSLRAISTDPRPLPAAGKQQFVNASSRGSPAPQWMTSALGYFSDVSKSVLPKHEPKPTAIERARSYFNRTASDVATVAPSFSGRRNNLLSAVAYFNAATRGLSG